MRAEHAALAKIKLSGSAKRNGELDHLAELLDDGEQVVTMADAIFRSQGAERRGLAVLTDRRLLCVDKGSIGRDLMAIGISGITSVEIDSSGGMGDARRGGLTIVANDVETEVARIHPWERAAEIRTSVIGGTAVQQPTAVPASEASARAMRPAPSSLGSFGDFESAAHAVLQQLQGELGLRHWMVTRTEGQDWIVLATRKGSGAYAIQAGDVLRWSDSFCSRMVRGDGPRIAPRAMDVPAYASAPMANQFKIAAYVGAPLVNTDGTLFGTLCAIDPVAQPGDLVDAQPTVELFARLLSTVLGRERQLAEEVRRREHAEDDADRDLLTGQLNERGWTRILAAEEARCKRTGAPACVIVGNLDSLNTATDRGGQAARDELLLFAARVIAAVCRPGDAAARLGEDGFAILAPETAPNAGAALLDRLRSVLGSAGIPASLGMASRNPALGLPAACDAADCARLAEKASTSA
jgi:diguanylate cyclase